MNKTHILILITDMDVGGAEQMVTTLASELDQERFDISVGYLRGSGSLANVLAAKGIHVINFQVKRWYRWGLLRQLKDAIHSRNIQLIHTHLILADFLGLIAGCLTKIPVVSTKHNLYYFRGIKKPMILLDMVLNRCYNRIVAISKSVKQYYCRVLRVPASRISVIRNGITLSKFSSKDTDKSNKADFLRQLSLPPDTRVISSIAHLTEQKGHEFLIRAIPEIVKKQSQVVFLFAGEGQKRPFLESLSHQLGIEAFVKFLGLRRNIIELLAHTDIFCLPSRWEGLGLSIIEAMAMGLPIVATKVGGIPELVRHETTGLLVPPQDPQAIANSITRLIADQTFAQRLGYQAQAFIQEHYSSTQMVQGYEELYEEIRRQKK